MAQAPPQSGLKAEEQRTKLFVPHNGGELTFLHPPYGPDTYANVGLAIEQDQLKRPTMPETASLVHTAFNSDDPRYIQIRDIMEREWLYAFTGTLRVTGKGVYIQDDPKIRNGMPFMDGVSLEQKLSAKDPNVRHVPFGYKVGEMTSLQLAENAYVIALAGEEGAKKLAEVAEKYYSTMPYLWSPEPVEQTLTSVSAIVSRLFGQRLGIVSSSGIDNLGRAFGLLSRAEK